MCTLRMYWNERSYRVLRTAARRYRGTGPHKTLHFTQHTLGARCTANRLQTGNDVAFCVKKCFDALLTNASVRKNGKLLYSIANLNMPVR